MAKGKDSDLKRFLKQIATTIGIESLVIGLPMIILLNMISKRFDELEERVDRLAKKHEEEFIALENQAEETLENWNEKLNNLEQQVDDLEERVDVLEEKFLLQYNYELLLNELGKNDAEYAKMRENLLRVKEKLNISFEEDEKYANVKSIGDAVNLVDKDVSVYADMYSLYAQENATTSLYGTTEVRYIESIIMSDDNLVVEIESMDEYEIYLSEDFYVIGYNLVNQFSLDENGNLTNELRCEEDGIKLIYEKKN